MLNRLAKIKDVKFGFNSNLFGLSIQISGDSWETIGSYVYDTSINSLEYNGMTDMLENIQKLLKDANVKTIDKLLNKPVECTFDGLILKGFRILTEVL